MEHLKNNVAIVILNYLNYLDTIECVESLLALKCGECGIVVVDNASPNESYTHLKQRYSKNSHVYLIKTKSNVGFARGNNVGISFAREKLKAEFVLVVNNDTVFTDKQYIKIMLKNYAPGIGALGSKVILRDKTVQPRRYEYLGIKDTLSDFVNAWSFEHGSSFDFPTRQGDRIEILQGCVLMFTPDFFKYYKGFYKKTFLYGEEPILHLMCKCKGLSQVYVSDTQLYHKENQSSQMSFSNDTGIKGKYERKSKKYIFWWSLKYYVKKLFLKKGTVEL